MIKYKYGGMTMEKLKCSSCGGHLEIEENKEYAKCKYCGARYKLNEDLNVNIKLDDNMKEILNNGFGTVQKFSKFAIIPMAIIFVIATFIIITIATSFNSSSDGSKNMFNIHLEHQGGTKSAFFLESTLDDIIQSNKTHNRKVALVFEGKETTDEKEIIDIKHSLSGTYEVSINYDDKGYVNKIIVEKIKY